MASNWRQQDESDWETQSESDYKGNILLTIINSNNVYNQNTILNFRKYF